ncbi:transposase, partial [Sulfuricurvum sp.]|uniref:RNA-guided endonuclease InsQ/TnpB family protein n=1 Tax=Sulfuricurvum sp. TaxID=2025608 RepID=UPI0019BFBA12
KRFVYNQLVAKYKDTKKFSKKEYAEFVKELRITHEWLQEFSTRVVRNCIDDLEKAIKNQFQDKTKKERNNRFLSAKTPKEQAKALNYGVVKFKKKGVNESFSIREKEKFKVNGKKLSFEKFKGSLKMRNNLRFDGQAKQVTISYQGGKWFASILVETTIPKREPSFEVVGVDLGVKSLATLSNGKVFKAHKSFLKREKKLAKLQKKLARAKKDSKNYQKTKEKIAKLHYFVSESRKQALHELTSYLSKNFKKIVIENLNISGMLKNRRLSKSIIDSGFGMFKEQLSYKCDMYGSELIIVDRFYPSSKTCSNCGSVKDDLKLSDRVYRCSNCGFEIDRDLNASINLKNVATGSGDTINDCGGLALATNEAVTNLQNK